MAELTGRNLNQHLNALLTEWIENKSVYGYSHEKFFYNDPDVDLSVFCFDRPAGTLLGPAAGPHTQLAQNIVLSFLAGSRIIELKTIQVNDKLNISRPCIDMRNIGLNTEWSQELKLADSYHQYVIAWILLKYIESEEWLDSPAGSDFYKTIFDISVGYDLKGISSDPVQQWISNMCNAEVQIQYYLQNLPSQFKILRQVKIDPHIAHTATLSTFHGCPPDEIEEIVRHLIATHRLNVVVKFNPTILGYETVSQILLKDLGYDLLSLNKKSFDDDITFDSAVGMMQRLKDFAAENGCAVGAKFTNTLVVGYKNSMLADPSQYLSGAPLHVLAIQAADRFRTAMGGDFPISFSAGIQKENFVSTVCTGLKPVTVCTDLLKKGGYHRMTAYLQDMITEMKKQGANTVDELITGRGDHADARQAGVPVLKRYSAQVVSDQRYHFQWNKRSPKKIDSNLQIFDCLSCDICIPVCPNRAVFSYAIPAGDIVYNDYHCKAGLFESDAEKILRIKKVHQIGILADFCNECGNCDTFCPENGGPYKEKPLFFFDEDSYRQPGVGEGFYFHADQVMSGRIDGIEYRLDLNESGDIYTVCAGEVCVEIDVHNNVRSIRCASASPHDLDIEIQPFLTMKILFTAIYGGTAMYFNRFLLEKQNED